MFPQEKGILRKPHLVSVKQLFLSAVRAYVLHDRTEIKSFKCGVMEIVAPLSRIMGGTDKVLLGCKVSILHKVWDDSGGRASYSEEGGGKVGGGMGSVSCWTCVPVSVALRRVRHSSKECPLLRQ